MTLTLKKGSHTPWGAAQHVRELVPGIWNVDTAGHGGIKLDRERHAQLPAECRREGGWFEEDCDICIPLAFFFDEIRVATEAGASFTRENLAASLARWNRRELAALVAAGRVPMTDEARAIVEREEAREKRETAARASGLPLRWSAMDTNDGRVHVLFKRADGGVEGRYMSPETYRSVPLGEAATTADYEAHGTLEPAPADFVGKTDAS